MMKIGRKLPGHILPLTTLLALACGRSPPEGTAGDSQSSTGDTDPTSTTQIGSATDPGSATDNNSATEVVTQGSMSAGETEATTGTDSTVGITGTESASDPSTSDPVTSATETASTGTSDTTSDPSASDTDTTGNPDSTTTTTDDTTSGDTTTGDTTTDGTTGEPVECGVQLKATIRDFKLGHPDFETYCCGVVQGLVQVDLGADKKPVFNQTGNPQMLTDAPTFNQWYNNVQDVNQSTQITLDLQEIMPGVFSYQNNNFFPIDNMLFGNQGNNHNFHFTTVPDTS